MAFSLSNLLKEIELGVTSVGNIATAVGAIKAAGASKETTLQKVGQIVEIAAATGETIPVPQVQAVSGLVLAIAEEVFGAPAAPAAPPPA